MSSPVYDFSGLDKQPAGSRVAETTGAWWERAHSDARGHRLGKDAFSVPKYRTVQDVADDGSRDEEFDFSADFSMDFGPSPPNGKGKEKETTPDPDSRSAKRRKVAHDFGFLETSLPHAVQTTTSSSPSAFAVPSSVIMFTIFSLSSFRRALQDLLKCIHHFACNYYSDRGQLFNASRTYRKAKKQRRLARLAAKEKPRPQDASSGEEEPAPDADTDPPKTQKDRRRDMYKVMDGSALLAIGTSTSSQLFYCVNSVQGMLLQEHIARMLAPRIPDGWEQGILDESEEEEEEEEPPNGEVEDTEDNGDEVSDKEDDENSNGDEHSEGRDEDDEEDDYPEDDNQGSYHEAGEQSRSSHSPHDDSSESQSDEEG
ncbi:hypothetical protein B0H19DRAFT_1114881 [Mycena capillaripes]|nr:hypothetical protein B0H19DRAFT_1114881 [Mycena capillaripes]